MKTLAASSVLALVLLVLPAASQAPDDKLIVPGRRIGIWTLEMTLDELARIVQPSSFKYASIPGWTVISWDNGLAAGTRRRNSRVEYLSISEESLLFGSTFKTDQGIGIGSSKDRVAKAYGSPTASIVTGYSPWRLPRNFLVIYDSVGLAVEHRYNGKVFNLTVLRPGSARDMYASLGYSW